MLVNVNANVNKLRQLNLTPFNVFRKSSKKNSTPDLLSQIRNKTSLSLKVENLQHTGLPRYSRMFSSKFVCVCV